MFEYILVNGKSTRREFDGRFDCQTDVAVVGLGTAGAIAAISAARGGASVAGIERCPQPGGVGVSGAVFDYYFGIRGGLYEKINERASELCESTFYGSKFPGLLDSVPASPKALALCEAFEAAGVKAFYNSALSGVITDDSGRKIKGLTFIRGGIRIRISAKIAIDGADGAVSKILGLPMMRGRRSDGRLNRYSRTVGLYGGDTVRGIWRFGGDAALENEFEKAEGFYREACAPPCLAEKYDGSSLLTVPPQQIGFRETRCCETDETYTMEMLLRGEPQQNVLLYATAPIDNVNPDLEYEDVEFVDWQLVCGLKSIGATVGVTAGMLIAKGADNLLVCGKAVGTGHPLCSCVRMKSDMERIGEAAGLIAAEALSCDTDIRAAASLRFDEIRAALELSDCSDSGDNIPFTDLTRMGRRRCEPAVLPEDLDELKFVLASDYPSPGLLAVLIGRFAGCEDDIAGWLSGGDFLSENAAVALALMGDDRALPVLRRIINEDAVIVTHEMPHKSIYGWLNYPVCCNFLKAVILLSRLKDDMSLPRLREIADRPDDVKIRGGEPTDRDNIRRLASAFAKTLLT